jgi:hypothetical protein
MIYTSDVLHTQQQASDALIRLRGEGGLYYGDVESLRYPCVLSMSDSRFGKKIHFTTLDYHPTLEGLHAHLQKFYKDDFTSPMALEDVLKL